MRQTSTQDRERAVHAITQRNVLQHRIDCTQLRRDALQGEAQHALENGLTSDQAALSEAIQTLEEVKGKMWQEEERIRGKTREALRFKAEWKSRQFSNSFRNDRIQSSQDQALCLVMILAGTVAIIGGVLLVLK